MKTEIFSMNHVFSKDVKPSPYTEVDFIMSRGRALPAEKYCAVKDFNLTVNQGEFLYISGARGSGKRELFDILTGRQVFCQGKITFGDQTFKAPFTLPAEALRISSIIPEEELPEGLSVAECIFLMKRSSRFFNFYKDKDVVNETEKLMNEFGLDINPRAHGYELTVAQQDIVKLLNAYINRSKLIVLFEVREQYTRREKQQIFELLKQIKKNKCGIIWIDRVLYQPVARGADTVLIMSGGRNAKMFFMDNAPAEIEEQFFIRLTDYYLPQKNKDPHPISNYVRAEFDYRFFDTDRKYDIKFDIKEGEIVGFYDKPDSAFARCIEEVVIGKKNDVFIGELRLDGVVAKAKNYRQNVKRGIRMIDGGYIERHVVSSLSVVDNLVLPLKRKVAHKTGLVRNDTIKFFENYIDAHFGKEISKKKVEDLESDIRDDVIWYIIFNRLIFERPKLVVCAEPFYQPYAIDPNVTMGYFETLVKGGTSCLLLSVYLEDLMRECDRIIVVDKTGEIRSFQTEEYDILLDMFK